MYRLFPSSEWKAQNGVSDKGFGKLLVMIKNMLPKDNEFPGSTYEAKKVVCPLGLDVQCDAPDLTVH